MANRHEGFEGHLLLAPGEQGLDARLSLGESGISVHTADGQTETWDKEGIISQRYDTCTIQFDVGDTHIFFAASDPLDFEEKLDIYLQPQPTRRWSRKPKSKGSKDPTEVVLPPAPKDPSRGRRQVHVHRTASSSVGAGIKREICLDCGHVSIDLTETFELEADPQRLLNLRR